MTFSEAVEYFDGSSPIWIDGVKVDIPQKGRPGLAAALNFTQQAVTRWATENYIPRGIAFELEVITRGALKARRADYQKRENPEIRKENRGARRASKGTAA